MASASPPIRVLIADDHGVVRSGFRALLVDHGGFEVAGMAADGEEAVALTRLLRPDVLLLDLSMPRLDGIGVLTQLADLRNQVRVVLLSAAVPRETEIRAFTLGARGLILKDASPDQLFRCLHAVMSDDYWIRRSVVGDLVRALEAASARPATPPGRFGLTEREFEITQMVASGYSNREIAEQCGVSADTVKHHVSNIFDKAGVSSRVELARFAIAHGMSDPPIKSQ